MCPLDEQPMQGPPTGCAYFTHLSTATTEQDAAPIAPPELHNQAITPRQLRERV